MCVINRASASDLPRYFAAASRIDGPSLRLLMLWHFVQPLFLNRASAASSSRPMAIGCHPVTTETMMKHRIKFIRYLIVFARSITNSVMRIRNQDTENFACWPALAQRKKHAPATIRKVPRWFPVPAVRSKPSSSPVPSTQGIRVSRRECTRRTTRLSSQSFGPIRGHADDRDIPATASRSGD